MKKLKLLLLSCVVAIAANAGTKTVYLAPGPWDANDATERYALYMFDNDAGTKAWTSFTEGDNGIWSATFDDTYPNMIICRIDAANETNAWNDAGGSVWNQTADLDAPIIDGLTYTVTKTGSDLVINDGLTVAGNFYLYNVGQGKYLTSGNWWGTHAALDSDGMLITVTAADGGYTLSTNVAFSGKYVNPNGYVDSDQAVWSFTVAEDNKYVLKSNNKYLVSTNSVVADVSDSEPTTSAGYWQLVTREKLIENLSNATKASPIEASFYMTNPKIRRNWPVSFSGENFSDKGSFNASAEGLYNGGCGSVGQYRKTFDNYQALTNVLNGKYKVTVKGFNRENDGYSNAYLYANNEKQQLKTKGDIGTDDAEHATRALVDDTYLVDAVEVTVTDGNLRVGVKSDGKVDWTTWREFTLMYLGKTISNVAVALPDGGAMAANTWYYFDLPSDSEYDIMTTTLGNIVYTKDGTILKEDESTVTANFSSDSEVELTEGRYYIKSSSAQSFEIVAHVKTYTVGDVTAQNITNGDYLGSLTTLVLTYGDAATNDGDAALAVIGSATAKLKKNGVDVATGTLTANDGAKTLTATFSDVTLVANATDYSIVIPAGAFGYEGESVNTEATVTFNTGLIADGLYYFQKKDTQKYLGRGGNYGTRAVVADLGISFELTVQADGKFYLKNHDHSLAANTGKYLGIPNPSDPYYSDANSAQAFIIAPADGGYYLRPDADNYLKTTTESTDIDVPFDYIDVTATEGDAIIWVPISKEAYAANIAAVRNAEAAAIATSAGETAVSVSALETLLADAEKFKAVDLTSSIKNAECTANLTNWTQVKYATNGQKDFDANGTTGEVWAGLGGIKQDIAGLAEGVYKVSVHATWRPGGKESGENAGNEINTNAWVYANTATSSNLTQLKSWYAGGATIDNRAGMAASGDTYLNDVYVYVSDGETLTIGLASPTECNGAWLPFFGWSLTYYKPKTTFTANFANGEDWENVYAYVWNGGGELTDEFPGEKISKSSTYRRNGIDYDVYTYSYTGFEDPANIIFSDGASAETTNKTADLTFVDGMTDLSKVPYIDAYAVVGGNNGDKTDEAYKAFFSNTWDAATQTDILTKVSEGVYSKTYSDLTLDKQTISYKIIKKDYLEATSAANWYDNDTDKNLTIDIPVKGIYDITFTFTVSGSVVSGVATKTAEAVTIGETGETDWATTVTNSALDFSGETEFTAYTATVSDNKVTLTQVNDVKAETGLVLKGTAGTYYVPVAVSSDTEKGDLLFSSTLTYNTWQPGDGSTNNFYGLKYDAVKEEAKFAKIVVDNGTALPAGKAFLLINTPAAGARELSVVFEGETTTGISTMKNEGAMNNAIYDLQGRKVNSQLKSGLYIMNGKKVVKK